MVPADLLSFGCFDLFHDFLLTLLVALAGNVEVESLFPDGDGFGLFAQRHVDIGQMVVNLDMLSSLGIFDRFQERLLWPRRTFSFCKEPSRDYRDTRPCLCLRLWSDPCRLCEFCDLRPEPCESTSRIRPNSCRDRPRYIRGHYCSPVHRVSFLTGAAIARPPCRFGSFRRIRCLRCSTCGSVRIPGVPGSNGPTCSRVQSLRCSFSPHLRIDRPRTAQTLSNERSHVRLYSDCSTFPHFRELPRFSLAWLAPESNTKSRHWLAFLRVCHLRSANP